MPAPQIRLTLEGSKQLEKKLKAIAGDKGMRKVARAALLELGAVLVEKMQAGTPVKKGKLRDSEKTRALVSAKKEDLRITLVAGGDEAPYAAIVHDRHKTKSKFMERVLLGAVPTAGQDLANRIDMRRVAAEGGA